MKKTAGLVKPETAVTDALSRLLADTYLLYLKTQNYHWNVTGPTFFTLHTMFEEQYKELSEAVDLLAERLRALSAQAPGSFAEFMDLASLKEANPESDAKDMVATLLRDHESMAVAINSMLGIAGEACDEVTIDILIARKTEHDKTAWMLRSTLVKLK